MRILLVQSYLGRREKLVYPLGIAVLGTYLEQAGGVDVRCYDLNTQPAYEKPLTSILNEWQPDAIGLSLRNIDTTQTRDLFYYYHSFIEQLRFLRACAPNAKLLVGGAGFSLYAERIMQDNQEIDFGFHRESEKTMLEFCSGSENPEQIPGLWYRNNGSVAFSGQREPLDLAELLPVRWDILDLEPYRSIPGAIGIETKRGCILHCEYCTYPFLDGPVIRKHPVERVLTEIQSLQRDHGIDDFTFVDSIFNIPPDHAREIVEGMIERKIPVHWVGWFNERALDENFVDRCIQAGCREFSFSPDGFSPRTLKELGKSISRADILKTFDFARKRRDVNVSYNFVGNPPGQDIISLIRLLIFMVRCKVILKDQLKGFCITNLRIEPNTGIYQRALREGIVQPSTDLLPPDVSGLRKLFYTNPTTRFLNILLAAYVTVWSVRKWLKSLRGV